MEVFLRNLILFLLVGGRIPPRNVVYRGIPPIHTTQILHYNFPSKLQGTYPPARVDRLLTAFSIYSRRVSRRNPSFTSPDSLAIASHFRERFNPPTRWISVSSMFKLCIFFPFPILPKRRFQSSEPRTNDTHQQGGQLRNPTR